MAIDLLYFWDVYNVNLWEKVSYHSKTLLHRNQAQERLWFARLLFKNDKETLTGVEFGEACKGTFFNRTSPVVASGLFF